MAKKRTSMGCPSSWQNTPVACRLAVRRAKVDERPDSIGLFSSPDDGWCSFFRRTTVLRTQVSGCSSSEGRAPFSTPPCQVLVLVPSISLTLVPHGGLVDLRAVTHCWRSNLCREISEFHDMCSKNHRETATDPWRLPAGLAPGSARVR